MVVWSPPWATKKPIGQPSPSAATQKPPAGTDILGLWKTDQLPPELLQKAQVPPYKEWKKLYEPEPGWGVRPQGYVPQVTQIEPKLWEQGVSMRPTTGEETPVTFTEPEYQTRYPGDIYQGMGLSPEYAHPYETGVAKPITGGILERWDKPKPTPETPAYKSGLQGAGLYGLPSQEKQENIRQLVAGEVPYAPLYFVPIPGGAKATKMVTGDALKKLIQWGEKELARLGEGSVDDIIKRMSLAAPESQAREIIAKLTGKVTSKIPEVAPKEGEVAKTVIGEVPRNLPPKVAAKLQPIPPDPLGSVRDKILLLNERVKSAITKQEALYRAERGGRFAKAEEALAGAETAEAGQRAALHELKGQLPKQSYNPQDVGLTPGDKALVKDYIRLNKDYKTTERINALDGIDRLFGKFDAEGNRILPQRNQVKLINRMLGTNLPEEGKNLSLVLDAMNIPRATLASLDVSAGLRQNVFFLFGHPKASAKAIWGGGIKPFFGEAWNDFAGVANYLLKKSGSTKEIRKNNWTKEVEASIEGMPWYDQMVDLGWPITERSAAGGKLLKREETYASKFAANIPFVRWSEAGYVNLLNKARVDVGSSCLDKWVRAGVNVDDDFIRMWGRVVGQLTGRGDWEAIRQALPVFNSFLFSPRLQLARVQLPLTYIQCLKNPAYRPIAKEMTRNIVAFVAGNATLLGLAYSAQQAFGKDKISVDFNPISTDFGRIKMGNTRADFSGGFVPYIRLIAQLLTNRKMTADGKVVSLDEWPYGGRWGLLTRFGEMKFAPSLSLVRDVWSGQDAVGNPIIWTPEGIGKEAYKRLTPMALQDTIDAVNEHGLAAGMAYGTLAFFGATVMTYEPNQPKKTTKRTTFNPVGYKAPSKPLPGR